ncbi:MAG TPA: hypothetical protein VFV67_30100 [Actinophytocola sp.]|uniref:hypothetical protein n=1 Tax=Actinophytocola sp. TaxID=1872138 RepID=UPI002DBA7911|nr:hypothetical protein [Actinophytocola sp.]HEU5474916.1 hypothetical protein [Actinophytocola sp.]
MVEASGLTVDVEIVEWLLAGDPAIRWQTLRDLQGAPTAEWRREQRRVATEGWGARLLAHRDSTGRWTPRLHGQKWISTTYTLLLLRQLGLPPDDPRARESCRLFLDEGLWRDGGINVTVTQRRSETCVTGIALGLLSWFGVTDPRRERLVDYLLRAQMPDGGWNCQRDHGAAHGSFHTTANVLDGLCDYADANGSRRGETLEAEARGREFLLAHRLYRSHRTGAVVDPRMLRLTFPPRWRYDVLRGLDYFRAANASRDARLEDAIGVILSRRGRDGRWPVPAPHPGAVWFDLEQPGQPSRWNTLRALRVLGWWSNGPR